MADISPKEENLPRIAEYENTMVTFSADLESNESLISLEITVWDENDGIIVRGASFSGEYTNTFDYGSDRLLMRLGDDYKPLQSWDDIIQPNLTDVYTWKAPVSSAIYTYTVHMIYSVESESGEGESGGSGGTGGGGSTAPMTMEMTKVYSHEVYPNWDIYANKLRVQIAKRRETWLE